MKYLLLIASFFFFSVEGHSQAFYTETGTAIFHSEVPMHTFSGKSEYLTGKIDLNTKIVDFYLDLTTLETGISKRDRDMRETLETEKFPFAEFYGEMITPFDPDTSVAQEITVQGTFKIHGVEKDTTYTGTLEMQPDGLMLTANWVLRLEDYNIVPPSLLFFKVDQEQKIEIKALLKPMEDH
ncbi:MAG: hypothetical protein CL666_07255 [Balneola sp.]|nr:hypothetical protein [Balneola sp.]|tara:strand:+ start:82 stop:627 length:546 start_codon:yes stop_codon:yes gene_type:complete